MKRIILFFLLIVPLLASSQPLDATFAQPKYEVRAVWLTTIGGIDWPSTYAHDGMGIQTQKQQLCQMLDRLKKAGVNTVMLQTRVRATTGPEAQKEKIKNGGASEKIFPTIFLFFRNHGTVRSYCVTFLHAVVLLCMAITTYQLKIIPVKSDAFVVDVLRRQVNLVMYDSARNNLPALPATLTQSANGCRISFPAALPRL